MTTTVNRRTFNRLLLTGVGTASLPAWAAADVRKLRIGCTALIWGSVPRTPEKLADAVRDMAALGFHGFETFASIVEEWDTKGTLAPLLQQHRIPLISTYASVQLTDASKRKEGLEQLVRQGKIARKHGGRFMVLAPNGVKREGYDFAEHKASIVAGLNDFAMAMNDIGLGAGLHQHTGTAVESRDETYAVMETVNTAHLKFAPDVGQLQKGGANAAQVVKDFKSITVHMHLKDFKGWEHFAGYCPLGQGKVDLKSILDTMEEANPNANIMHELDGSSNAPYTPFETAKIGVGYLETLGYSFRAPS